MGRMLYGDGVMRDSVNRGVSSGVNAVISGAGVKTGAYTRDGVNDGVLIDKYGVVGVGILSGTLTGVNTSKWVTARMPRQEK